MLGGYWSGLSSYLVFWSGWVFTVGGAAVGLYLGKEYAWIGWLCLAAGMLALLSHNRELHQLTVTRHRDHEKERAELRAQLLEEVKRREGAERKLAEVPAEALARLGSLLADGIVAELVANLQLNAELINRLRLFVAESPRPLAVRTFQFLQGELYVVAKGQTGALVHLRPGDPFRLVKRSEAGIEIAAARLVVHQPVATRDEVVRFRVTEALADDITHLSALAGVGSVEGVKGYSLTLGIDLDGIPSFNGADIAAVIPHLARTITAQQGK